MLHADLAAVLLANPRREIRIIKSVSRALRPRFATFEEWLRALEPDDREHVLDAVGAPTQLGRVISAQEQAHARGGRPPLRHTMVIIELQVRDFSFPEHVHCALCLLFEDFGGVFDEHNPTDDLGAISNLFNNWLHVRDRKKPSTTGDWFQELEGSLDVLNLTSFVQLPLYREWLVQWLVGCTQDWWHSRVKPAVAPETISALSQDSQAWITSHTQSGRYEPVDPQPHMDVLGPLLRQLCYWSWWRSAGRGWIESFREPSTSPGPADRPDIAAGLRRLDVNETELRQVLLDHFVRISSR